MTFPRWLFRLAAVYGLIVLVPQYFLEHRIGLDHPPAITHREYFYGFLGVAIAWQLAFLIIARDPFRYRLMMIPAMLEKASFGIAAIALYTAHDVPGTVLGFGLIDLAWCALFAIAYWRTAIRRL